MDRSRDFIGRRSVAAVRVTGWGAHQQGPDILSLGSGSSRFRLSRWCSRSRPRKPELEAKKGRTAPYTYGMVVALAFSCIGFGKSLAWVAGEGKQLYSR